MSDATSSPRVSVLMPTWGQARFIRRALDSLLTQELTDWELLIVDDASPDATREMLTPFLADARVRYTRLLENQGTSAALNVALEQARAPLVAYLPSDDMWYREHLATLVGCLDAHPTAALAYSGVRHTHNRLTDGQIEGEPLQPTQVAHRLTPDRWTEREELVSDDHERLFWRQLRSRGEFVATGSVTCEWVDHPDQLHKLLREPLGGVNRYRQRFDVRQPLRFHTTVGNRIDEGERYRRFRERPDTPPAADGLKIVLCGELAYNPERVLALEERGHRLYGLWMPEPHWHNTVGPLPFGHVIDLPRDNWRAALSALRPDVIYALLNWQAVPFAAEVLRANTGAPFVWHFKEGPFICLEKGIWDDLVDLCLGADGLIYSSPEMRDWFHTAVPGSDRAPTLILDGDLPKRDWFTDTRTRRLSDSDGEPHTVVPGRPIGMHPWRAAELAHEGIHLHFYGDFTHGQWRQWIATVRELAPRHLHLHAQVDQERWVEEFSRYDAGWLHVEPSHNGGDIRRATWDDLNYPARMATLVAAGLPLIQLDNRGAIFATQTLARALDIGLFITHSADLRAQLRDERRMAELRANVWRVRERFTFDYHADRLLAFFREVIAHTAPEFSPSPPIGEIA